MPWDGYCRHVSALQWAWGHLKPTEIQSRAQGAMWRGLALRQEVVLGPSNGKRSQDRVRGEVRAGDPAPSSNSKAAEQGHLLCLKDSDSECAEGTGARDHSQCLAILLPLLGSSPSERPPCLVLVSSIPSVPSPAPITAGACEVGELQETRMLNYRAALETSNGSGTVARRGGSRAVNRNCGGSRGEQSEGGFCACITLSPSLPSSFSHLSWPRWLPAQTGV